MAEIAVIFPNSADAWSHFRNWRIYWIAGFCRYYREPVISLDGAFDRVPGLRRLSY